MPASAPYLTAGFVSEAVADEKGNFLRNPEIKITLEAAMVYYGLDISFAGKSPLAMTIHTSYEGEAQESFSVYGPWEKTAYITNEFLVFDTIVIEFTKAPPNSRVFVRSVIFGEVTDYTMDYHGMTKYPKGIQKEKVSRVEVIRNLYTKSAERKNILQEEAEVTSEDIHTFYFSEPCCEVEVTAGDELLRVLETGSYFVTVDVSALSGIYEFTISGKVYLVTNKPFSRRINTTGKSESWNNPLVSTEELAEQLADWLGSYFANNIEYSIAYRGEPRLDAGDIIFLENKYVKNLQIQIYEHSLSFNGSLSGTVKARRAVSQDG